jgi:hypothetical protein
VLGAAGTRSSTVNPVPAVYVAALLVMTAPKSRSPAAVLATVPLFGAALVPCATAVTSSEFARATPEYSSITKRNVLPLMVSATVTEFTPPAMFSA